jgi:hypothetical protein
MVIKRKARKTKGGFGGIDIKESHDSKRQRIMDERREKERIKKEKAENKRTEELEKLRRNKELYDARTSEASSLAKSRMAASLARQYHPLRRGLAKMFAQPKKQSRKRKIKWI